LRRTPRPHTCRSRSWRAYALVAALPALLVVTACRPQYKATLSSWSVPVGTVSGAVVASRAGLSPGVNGLWDNVWDQSADLAAIAATGAKWTTLDVDWNSIQGDGPDSFRWDRGLDAAVLNMRAHGLTIIGVAGYAPPWARTSGCPTGDGAHCMPANAADYGRFMTAAASRYGATSSNPFLRGSITTWQLWNEPNHQAYAQPKPNLDTYTAMLKSAYAGIKWVDPSATVVTGGTAPAPDAADGTEYQPETWLQGLYARGAKGFFDAVGHHPAAYPFNPLEPHSWNAYTQTQVLHDVMAAHGDGAKKVWGTEVAAPTGTGDRVLTETQQAQWVRDYYIGWNTVLRSITGPLVWMPLRDAGSDPSAREDNMGLIHRDRTPKPAYNTYRFIMAAGV
jgi:hypothetical protein